MIAWRSLDGSVVKYSAGAIAPVRHQIVVFPHAGGAESFYRPWRRYLPDDVDLLIVQYPGRETRALDDAWPDGESAVEQCSAALNSLLGIAPLTVFGHSMGAL